MILRQARPAWTLLLLLLGQLFQYTESYRSSSFKTGGNAQANWEYEHNSDSTDRYSRARAKEALARASARGQAKVAHVRSQLDKHGRDVMSMYSSHRSTVMEKLPPAVQVDPVHGTIEALKTDMPIFLSQDIGSRDLAAAVNLLPKNMAPNPEKAKTPEANPQTQAPNAKTNGVESLISFPDEQTPGTGVIPKENPDANAVLGLIPASQLPSTGAVHTLALETTQPAELIVFSMKNCEGKSHDQLVSDGFKIPNDATRAVLPVAGKHVLQLKPIYREANDPLAFILIHTYAATLPLLYDEQYAIRREPLPNTEGVTPKVVMDLYEIATEGTAAEDYVPRFHRGDNVYRKTIGIYSYILLGTVFDVSRGVEAVRNVVKTTPLDNLAVMQLLYHDYPVRPYNFIYNYESNKIIDGYANTMQNI